jgi:hypothetical protein
MAVEAVGEGDERERASAGRQVDVGDEAALVGVVQPGPRRGRPRAVDEVQREAFHGLARRHRGHGADRRIVRGDGDGAPSVVAATGGGEHEQTNGDPPDPTHLGARTYPVCSAAMVLGVVWHYWLAPVLVLTVLAILAATLFGYLRKVTAPRYPKH